VANPKIPRCRLCGAALQQPRDQGASPVAGLGDRQDRAGYYEEPRDLPCLEIPKRSTAGFGQGSQTAVTIPLEADRAATNRLGEWESVDWSILIEELGGTSNENVRQRMDLSGFRGPSELPHQKDVRGTGRLPVRPPDDGPGRTNQDWPVEVAWCPDLHGAFVPARHHRRISATGTSRYPEEVALHRLATRRVRTDDRTSGRSHQAR